MVSCDERDRRSLRFIQHPCLIVEVLSPATEGYDSGDKFMHYCCINTLQEYVLINSQRISVECFRLNERGIWELYPHKEEDKIYIKSIDFRCSLSLLYEEVELLI